MFNYSVIHCKRSYFPSKSSVKQSQSMTKYKLVVLPLFVGGLMDLYMLSWVFCFIRNNEKWDFSSYWATVLWVAIISDISYFFLQPDAQKGLKPLHFY